MQKGLNSQELETVKVGLKPRFKRDNSLGHSKKGPRAWFPQSLLPHIRSKSSSVYFGENVMLPLLWTVLISDLCDLNSHLKFPSFVFSYL